MNAITPAAAVTSRIDPGKAPKPARTQHFSKRTAALLITAIVVLAASAWYGDYYYRIGRFLESTDDAYVQADITILAPKVSGYIAEVLVEDNQTIKAGSIVAKIDDRDFRAALDQAAAGVLSAQADVANLAAQLTEQQSVIAQSEAAIASDQAGVTFAQEDYRRYHQTTTARATSVQDEQRALTALQQQSANLQRDRAALAAARQHVAVLASAKSRAETEVSRLQAVAHQAALNLGYTTITAPIDGTVGARGLRVGQYVQAGTQLMAVVPLGAAYVIANFKETQLTHIRKGQRATITIDSYPGAKFSGYVDSVAPASGLEFALLPPDNATGNFTKIVQRIPVKIMLDPRDLAGGLLKAGMSVIPTVNTESDRS